MNKKWLIIIGILLVLAMGIMQFLFPHDAPSPTASELMPAENTKAASLDSKKAVATNSPARPSAVVPPLSLAKGDTVAFWDFKGLYADNPESIAKASTEIKRLLDLVGKGAYSDMALYVAIANQYELLGEGRQQYDYLGRATRVAEDASGLPWHNLGVLMERLGALETARVAYEKATLIQPEMKFYHYAYMEFLTARMKDNAAAIEKEFAAAKEDIGQDADILALYSAWKQS